jgi:hypothetical protein
MAIDQLEVETRDNYRWVALTNTTAAVFMSALDGFRASSHCADLAAPVARALTRAGLR